MNRKITLRLFMVLTLLEGIGVISLLLMIPSDPKNVWLLGYSRNRLLMVGGVLVAVFGCAGILIKSWVDKTWEENLLEKIIAVLSNNWVYIVGLIMLLSLFLFTAYVFVLSNQITDKLIRVRLERLTPILLWGAILSIQTVAVLPPLIYDRIPWNSSFTKKAVLSSIFAIIAFVIIALGISFTRIGLEPDRVGWDNFGAPILITQVTLSIIIALTLLGIGKLLTVAVKKIKVLGGIRDKFNNVDLLLAVLIWVAAVMMWSAAPIQDTYFSPPPRPPTNQYYPYSDAGLHDIAGQNLILGEGYQPVAEKPLYSLFLGLSHLVLGQDYVKIIRLQTLILALFPVVIFSISTIMFHRIAGIISAVLIIFRELNTIALSGVIRVSDSKQLMTDLPAAFGIALFTLTLVWWLSRYKQKKLISFIVGGVLGLVLLVRSQAILIIPFLLVVIIFLMYRDRKRLIASAGLFLLGVFVLILPWMWRNYLTTGQFGYSQPKQALYIAKQYSLTPEADDPGFPDDAALEEYTSYGFDKMIKFALEYPEVVANFILAHFVQNELSSLFIFPIKFDNVAFDNSDPPFGLNVDPFQWRECCSINTLIQSVPFWDDWTGQYVPGTGLPILVNLLLLSIGIGVAWYTLGIVGLLPLIIHLAYSLSVAVARISGWRLILPVDWVAIVYYCIGLAVVVMWGINYLAGKRIYEFVNFSQTNNEMEKTLSIFTHPTATGVGVAIILIGLFVPVAEYMFPKKFNDPTQAQAIAMWDQSRESSDPESELFFQFLEREGSVAMVGRAIYPRYYLANRGEASGGWPGIISYPRNRLGFYLAGPAATHVVLPLADQPQEFPSGLEVMVIGCQVDDYIEALAVVEVEDNGRVFMDVDQSFRACPS